MLQVKAFDARLGGLHFQSQTFQFASRLFILRRQLRKSPFPLLFFIRKNDLFFFRLGDLLVQSRCFDRQLIQFGSTRNQFQLQRRRASQQASVPVQRFTRRRYESWWQLQRTVILDRVGKRFYKPCIAQQPFGKMFIFGV